MQARIRSLRKILIVRLIALSAVVSILAGAGTFFLERNKFETVIAERTNLSVELLRLRILDIAAISHRPWGTFSKALGFADLSPLLLPLTLALAVILGLSIALLNKQER